MRAILLAGVLATALLWAAPARADHVFLQINHFPVGIKEAAAQGRLIPGRGPVFTRREALEAIEGINRCGKDCRYGINISIPEADHRYYGTYQIFISGPGYPAGSMLVSNRTRVPGLISIYDIEPTVRALDRGETPPVTARRVEDVQGRLSRLDQRITDLNDSRMGAGLALGALMAVFALLAALKRSPFFGRAALLTVPIGLSTALALSALEVTEPATVVSILAMVTAAGALALAWLTRNRFSFAVALLAIFPVYLLVLAISTETSSLAVIGPRPENGGRFYGFNNQLETLVLVPAFLGAYLLGPRLLPAVALLALVTVGASFAGADGGGVLVLLAGLLFLWLRLRGVPMTPRNLALTGGAVVVLGLVLVGLDAAFGGESHVTRSIGGGPAQLAEDIGDRLLASAKGVVSTWHSALVIGVSIPVLVWVALRRPRYAALDALLVAVAVSLIVNDAPREVSGFGALSALALRFWHETAERLE